jgi:hypothetical protein
MKLPYRSHVEQNIDNHQVGYVDTYIGTDGRGTVTVMFSNGKQWAGNTFAATTRFIANDGTVLLTVYQVKGLDGSYMGRAREGTVTNAIELSPDDVARFRALDVKLVALNDGVDVGQVAENLRKHAERFVGSIVKFIPTRASPPPLHERVGILNAL